MPELPDIAVYIEALEQRIGGERLERVELRSAFLLRTAEPPPESAHGRRVVGLRRIGKRIAIELEGELFLVLHLMIAGRLRWLAPERRAPRGRGALASFAFAPGTLLFTEAGTKRRASLHVIAGEPALRAIDPGGLDVLGAELAAFAQRVQSENHTLKRALTDPRLLSGIGNAYSDEILHRAQLSPLALSASLTPEAMSRLYEATREVLREWTARLREQAAGAFPEKVSAFRAEMAVHGRFREPCPRCGAPVQRIVYAQNETNYCAVCQTGGKLLADRALSRLLHKNWPKNIDELG